MNNNKSTNNNMVLLPSVSRYNFASVSFTLLFFFCSIAHFIYLLSFLIGQHTQFFVWMTKVVRESNSVYFSFSLCLCQTFPPSLSLPPELFLLYIYYMSASASSSLFLVLCHFLEQDHIISALLARRTV